MVGDLPKSEESNKTLIELADSPDFLQLRKEFLAYVEHRHAEFGLSRDFQGICGSLGIRVVPTEIPGERSFYSALGGQPIIHLDSSEPPTRSAFSLAHELCHYFFDEDEHAFKATLEDTHRNATPEALRDMEEELCLSGAGVLLFPSSTVERALSRHGLHPQAVIDLIQQGGSMHAALRRVIETHMSMQLWGFVVDRNDRIEYHHKTRKYQPAKNAQLPPMHPILAARSGYIETKAPAHFKQSWPIFFRAIEYKNRIIAIGGSPRLPDLPNAAQGTLFG